MIEKRSGMKAELQETLKTFSKYRRGRKDRYCDTSSSLETRCRFCCISCKKICSTPKCWNASTLRNCPWQYTAEEILAKKLDNSFETKNQKKWRRIGI